ncbi:MAG TPA: hypothetical protein VNT99_21190 [Methylomirabilota bacterium]|nr:hypothetical protein [Methylomirabilota bacterium]
MNSAGAGAADRTEDPRCDMKKPKPSHARGDSRDHRKKASSPTKRDETLRHRFPPFALDGHVWLPHEWVAHYPADAVLKQNDPGKLSLVRVGPSTRCFPKPTESSAAIKGWTKERHMAEMERLCSDGGATGNVFVRARVSKDATNCIGIHTNQFFGMLMELAKEKNEAAIEYVLQITRQGCVFLKGLSETNPELLRPAARRSWRWPVLKSLHPYLSDEHELICKNLQLGQDTPFEIHPSARWKTDAAGVIAFCLLTYLYDARERDAGPLGKHLSAFPKFSEDSAPRWWKVGQYLLLLAYPNPERVPELESLVKAPSHRKSPGRVRFRIMKILRDRFLSLAPPD